jgi:hypothetical protein
MAGMGQKGGEGIRKSEGASASELKVFFDGFATERIVMLVAS